LKQIEELATDGGIDIWRASKRKPQLTYT